MYDKAGKSLVYVIPDEIMTKLYELKLRVPTESDIKEYLKHKPDKKISRSLTHNEVKKFFGNDYNAGIDKIKKSISVIDNKIPMYDVYTENIYLVDRNDIYDKVMKDIYRFPTKKFLDILQKQKEDLESELMNLKTDVKQIRKHLLDKTDIRKVDKEMYRTFQYTELLILKHHKLDLGLTFMTSFDNQLLLNTYINAFYTYSNKLGKSLTVCKRPSFTYQLRHVIPYYSRIEIIKIALNMGLIKPDNVRYTDEQVRELCTSISNNDVNAKVLIDHQTHIIKNKMIGLVQYYSMQGSYFMNQYMRGQVNYNYENAYLESLIEPMWKLILEAPEFDKKYTVYRFIQTDEFISNMKIGDTYMERGFTSTTRDPFYQSDTYKFGWILMKIKLPANVKGCALCIETVSLFPKEEEIILPPGTIIKLLRKDEHSIYYHIDKAITNKVHTMYEFEVIGKKTYTKFHRNEFTSTEPAVDFLKMGKPDAITVDEKIRKFANKYVNVLGQFKVKIGSKEYTVISEWYDSSNVYKDYYALSTKNGYSMYTLHNNHLLFVIEIGNVNNIPNMYVNYNIKFTTLEREQILGSENFINFIASVAYFFDIPNVILYTDYVSCDYMTPIEDEHKMMRSYGGTYCVDFYEYLKNGTKKYSEIGILNTELMPKFKYHQLDLLKKIPPDAVLQKTDERDTEDRIYRIYTRTYKDFIPAVNNTLANFYVWFVDNHCAILGDLIKKFVKIPQYQQDNPFKEDYYIFNAVGYLYNKGKIETIPLALDETMSDNIYANAKNYPINRYRIVEEQRRR